MTNVRVGATDELDHGTSREIHGSSVQSSIVHTDGGDIHVPDCVLGPAFAQESSFLGLLAVVEQTLHELAVRIELAGVAHISTVQLHAYFAEHRVKRQVDWSGCIRVYVCPVRLVILASTCRRELFRFRYRSFEPVTLNSIAAPSWILASGAYSRLN